MDPPLEHRDNDERLLGATRETLATFHDDVKYLWCSEIQVYEEPPSALYFLRNHVALSRPCIIRNSILTTEHTEKVANEMSGESKKNVPLTMTLDDLVRLFPEADDSFGVGGNNAASREEPPSLLPPLCVDVTPDGHGDCLRRVTATDEKISGEEERVFVKPLETKMSLSDFRSRLRKGRAKEQLRQQQQNCRECDREEILDKVFERSIEDNPDEGYNACNFDDDFFEDCVLYYSRQNDCLREELSPLWNLKQASNHDVDDGESFVFPRTFPWAEEAFFGLSPPDSNSDSSVGVGPDAVNLWAGDERAVSAMHKDHYENLFYVLSGEKVFGLCPPSDAPFLYEREVLSGRFEVSGWQKSDTNSTLTGPLLQSPKWSVALDRLEESIDSSSTDKQCSRVHWIATDLFGNHSNRSDHDKEFPLSKYTHPITVRVNAGELLYLPSLWFHRVTQTKETVGINYWYDMNFESPMWCYFHFLQQLRSQEKSSRE